MRIASLEKVTPMSVLDLPLREQAALLQSGEVTAAELWSLTMDRIKARDGKLRSFVYLSDGETPAEGPLSGLPIAVKDIIDVAGMPTRCGSHAHDATPAEKDAPVVATLRALGMVPVGKVATYEYALTGPAYDQPNPPARNPWSEAHITGGSSSGSAAAVAGGLVRAALGTDTGGSVRSPASYSGCVGLKPTHGAVSDEGVFPLSQSLDVVGPLAASVDDAAFVYDAMTGRDISAELGKDIKGLRIGYARDWFVNDPACEQYVIDAMDDAAGMLSQLGAVIELITLPGYAPMEVMGCVQIQAEAWDNHKAGLAESYDRYGVDARRNLLSGAMLDDATIKAAFDFAADLRRTFDEALEPFAALLTPTTLSTAPAFADFEDGPVWTAMRTLPFNMTGHPAISVPCGFANGLPLGMQLVGRYGDEGIICRIAHAFEQATNHTARPALQDGPLEITD